MTNEVLYAERKNLFQQYLRDNPGGDIIGEIEPGIVKVYDIKDEWLFVIDGDQKGWIETRLVDRY